LTEIHMDAQAQFVRPEIATYSADELTASTAFTGGRSEQD